MNNPKKPEKVIEQSGILAKLPVDEKEMLILTSEVARLIKFFDRIRELDTEGIEPDFHVEAARTPLREVSKKRSIDEGSFLKNAPSVLRGYFRVPPVMPAEPENDAGDLD